eukprot:jgi/Chrzof1/3364/Cz12g22130.t1
MQTSLPPSYDQLVQLYSACQSDKETLKEELAAAHAKLTKSEAVRKQLKEQLAQFREKTTNTLALISAYKQLGHDHKQVQQQLSEAQATVKKAAEEREGAIKLHQQAVAAKQQAERDFFTATKARQKAESALSSISNSRQPSDEQHATSRQIIQQVKQDCQHAVREKDQAVAELTSMRSEVRDLQVMVQRLQQSLKEQQSKTVQVQSQLTRHGAQIAKLQQQGSSSTTAAAPMCVANTPSSVPAGPQPAQPRLTVDDMPADVVSMTQQFKSVQQHITALEDKLSQLEQAQQQQQRQQQRLPAIVQQQHMPDTATQLVQAVQQQLQGLQQQQALLASEMKRWRSAFGSLATLVGCSYPKDCSNDDSQPLMQSSMQNDAVLGSGPSSMPLQQQLPLVTGGSGVSHDGPGVTAVLDWSSGCYSGMAGGLLPTASQALAAAPGDLQSEDGETQLKQEPTVEQLESTECLGTRTQPRQQQQEQQVFDLQQQHAGPAAAAVSVQTTAQYDSHESGLFASSEEDEEEHEVQPHAKKRRLQHTPAPQHHTVCQSNHTAASPSQHGDRPQQQQQQQKNVTAPDNHRAETHQQLHQPRANELTVGGQCLSTQLDASWVVQQLSALHGMQATQAVASIAGQLHNAMQQAQITTDVLLDGFQQSWLSEACQSYDAVQLDAAVGSKQLWLAGWCNNIMQQLPLQLAECLLTLQDLVTTPQDHSNEQDNLCSKMIKRLAVVIFGGLANKGTPAHQQVQQEQQRQPPLQYSQQHILELTCAACAGAGQLLKLSKDHAGFVSLLLDILRCTPGCTASALLPCVLVLVSVWPDACPSWHGGHIDNSLVPQTKSTPNSISSSQAGVSTRQSQATAAAAAAAAALKPFASEESVWMQLVINPVSTVIQGVLYDVCVQVLRQNAQKMDDGELNKQLQPSKSAARQLLQLGRQHWGWPAVDQDVEAAKLHQYARSKQDASIGSKQHPFVGSKQQQSMTAGAQGMPDASCQLNVGRGPLLPGLLPKLMSLLKHHLLQLSAVKSVLDPAAIAYASSLSHAMELVASQVAVQQLLGELLPLLMQWLQQAVADDNIPYAAVLLVELGARIGMTITMRRSEDASVQEASIGNSTSPTPGHDTHTL